MFSNSEPAQGVQRRRFRRAHKIELDNALDVLIILFWQSQSHGAHGEDIFYCPPKIGPVDELE